MKLPEFKKIVATLSKRSKMRNKPLMLDGQRFDSQWECLRYSELKLLERLDQISQLKCQVKYRCEVEGVLICHYFADFTYIDKEDNLIVEDAKGAQSTPVFKLKKKLMKALHNIEIQEVRKPLKVSRSRREHA